MNELKQSDFAPEELDITNIEGLFYIADYVLSTLRMSGYFYDDEGDFVAEQLSDQEVKVLCENFNNNNKYSYLNYRDNTELHSISDEYLDDLLAFCWRESLKIWAIRWDDRFKKPYCIMG